MCIIKKSHMSLLLGVTVAWLLFASIFLPTEKRYYKIQQFQHSEEVTEDLGVTNESRKRTSTVNTANSTTLPAVVLVTTSRSSRDVPIVFVNNVARTSERRPSEVDNEANIQLRGSTTTTSNSAQTNDTSILQNMPVSHTTSTEPKRTGNGHDNNDIVQLVHENNVAVERPENIENIEDERQQQDPWTGNYPGLKPFRMVSFNKYFDFEPIMPSVTKQEQTSYLANYKKFYPRYKKPIDEKYLQTMPNK